jgi:hypothetical protein
MSWVGWAHMPSPGDCDVAAIRLPPAYGGGQADTEMAAPDPLSRTPACTEASGFIECGWKPGDTGVGADLATLNFLGRGPRQGSRACRLRLSSTACGRPEKWPAAARKGPLSLLLYLSQRSSPSRVRSGKSFQNHKTFSSAAARPGPLRAVPKTALIQGKGGLWQGPPAASLWSARYL